MSRYDKTLKVKLSDGRIVEIDALASEDLRYYHNQSVAKGNAARSRYYFSIKYIHLKFKLMKEKYCE